MAAISDQLPLFRNADHPISLPVFEGPLDLLLFLIRKNEIDIYDIPIASITQQYLDFLHSMESLNLEIAGDFFVMAASLMLIKSRMLLPRDERPEDDPEDESSADPRWELVQQLIEYQRFKDAATGIDSLVANAANRVFREVSQADTPKAHRPLSPSDSVALWNAFNTVLRRLADKMVVGQIHDEAVTVADRMEAILRFLEQCPSFRFSDLLSDNPSPNFTIATFLALLELTRLKHLQLAQSANFDDIICSKSPPAPQPSPHP